MSKSNSVYHSLDLIEKRISEKLTVESIANTVYFSKDHYQRLFREVVGESVMEYVTKRKLTLAGRALLETDKAIIDIAMDFGYDSREGFSRSFKAYMGVSPADYRKYSLTAISRNYVKENYKMSYSKTTDEIIRELNELIVKIKDLTVETRKTGTEDAGFWNNVADYTETFANKIHTELKQVSSIAEHPDEISNGFKVVKIVDDIAFEMNLMALQTALTASQTPEYQKKYMSLADQYRDLAFHGANKAGKIHGFIRELSSLIINDMRKAAGEMIQNAIKKGKNAVNCYIGDTDYIKDEVSRIVDELSSTPIESVTELMLSDCIFKLQIISFSTNFAKVPNSDKVNEALKDFMDSLLKAEEYWKSIIKPKPELPAKRATYNKLQDIAFQGNILLFYSRGEIEKLISTGKINEKLVDDFNRIDNEISNCIGIIHNAERIVSDKGSDDVSVFEDVADRLNKVAINLDNLADKLDSHNGGLKLLAVEHKSLSERANGFVQEVIGLSS